ncbi:MAG: hypothetical protein AAGK04_04415 [Planctomycetota bacterium]
MCLSTLLGCAADSGVREDLRRDMVRGAYASARVSAADDLGSNRGDRDYLLSRVRLLAASMADGTDFMADHAIAELYDLLRTQGLNEDRTSNSVIVGERNARIWKGEPFEQALAYAYIGLHDALEGDWGNARAAARNALFLLREFEGQRSGDALRDRLDLIETADAALLDGADPGEVFAYESVASDFELGYLLLAIAAREAGYPEEVDDALRRLRAIAPDLTEGDASVGARVARGDYDLVVVASYGSAPDKVRSGPDGAIGLFEPTTYSSGEALVVRAGGAAARAAIATDVNRMARDLRWTSLEELRVARAQIGQALVAVGLTTAAIGAGSDGDDAELATIIGLGVAGIGALLQANAGADVRHAETLPQRLYVAPVRVPVGADTLTVQIEGWGDTRVSIPLEGVRSRLVYVRLSEGIARWAPETPSVVYASDATGVPGSFADGPAWWGLPYVLGGRDVRTPTASVVEDYWGAGLPRSIGVNDLRELYRDEGVVFGEAATRDPTLRHVLEGGRGLYAPRGGSVGFLRLMCREAEAYRPTSARGRSMYDAIWINELEGRNE